MTFPNTYHFEVPIIPKAKKRPRVYRWSTVNPSKDDEDILRKLFIKTNKLPAVPLDTQLKVAIKFYRPIPKNIPKWKIPLMDEGIIRPTVSPDLDNYTKLILDSLNGILWSDDRVIVELHTAKYYSSSPKIELTVAEYPIIKTQKDSIDYNLFRTNVNNFFPLHT